MTGLFGLKVFGRWSDIVIIIVSEERNEIFRFLEFWFYSLVIGCVMYYLFFSVLVGGGFYLLVIVDYRNFLGK